MLKIKVYLYNLLTRTNMAFDLDYKATDDYYSKYRKIKIYKHA